MNTLLSTIFSPIRAFNQLKTEKFSMMSLLMILLLVLVNLILMMPLTEKITQLTMESMPVGSAQTDMAMELVYKLRYVMMIGAVFTSVIMLLLYALILYLVARVSKVNLEFMKIFQLMVCCYIAVVIGSLVNTAFLLMRGIDAIQTMYDASLIGLNVFTSVEKIGLPGFVFLSNINPFQLWFVALICIGIAVIAEIKPAKAIIIGVVFWFIIILFPVISAYFSQLKMAKLGL